MVFALYHARTIIGAIYCARRRIIERVENWQDISHF